MVCFFLLDQVVLYDVLYGLLVAVLTELHPAICLTMQLSNLLDLQLQLDDRLAQADSWWSVRSLGVV